MDNNGELRGESRQNKALGGLRRRLLADAGHEDQAREEKPATIA